MKNTFKWMFAAILICGLTFSSCKKDPEPTPEPEPTTQTVLAGMTAIGVAVFDSVTYSYEYDDQYRLVRSKLTHTHRLRPPRSSVHLQRWPSHGGRPYNGRLPNL